MAIYVPKKRLPGAFFGPERAFRGAAFARRYLNHRQAVAETLTAIGDTLTVETINHLLAFTIGIDHPRLPQYRQMTADCRLRQSHLADYLVDRPRLMRQKTQYPQSRRIAKGLEVFAEKLIVHVYLNAFLNLYRKISPVWPHPLYRPIYIYAYTPVQCQYSTGNSPLSRVPRLLPPAHSQAP